MEYENVVPTKLSNEALQVMETEKIEDCNKLNNEELTFKEYYNLCIRARFSSKETYERLKNFITININNSKYKTCETLKDTFGVYEEDNLICTLYKIGDEYYIPPNSIQIYGLYEE